MGQAKATNLVTSSPWQHTPGRVSPYRVIFMGTPDFGVPSLRALLESNEQVVMVVTQPDRLRGRGRKPTPSPVKILAEEAKLPILQPQKARDPAFLDEVRRLTPDLLVVAAYGQILPQILLDIPRLMPINVHGSLLPKYRGAAPIQWAIIGGESETGITIMLMDAGMDTGPILLQEALAIRPEESFGDLYGRMAHLGADLLLKALRRLRAGTLHPKPQPDKQVSYAPPIRTEMARLDWSQAAERLANLVRALDPRPGAYALSQDHRLRMYRPFVLDMPGAGEPPGTVCRAGADGLVVATGKGYLGILELQWPGKRRLPVAEFLRGRPIPQGTVLGQ